MFKPLTAVVLAASLLVLSASTIAEEVGAPADPKLQPLAKFVGGEWIVHGQWADGNELDARGVYEWGLGRRIIKARTYTGKGTAEIQRYESIMAWSAERKSLYEISFAVDGAITEYKIETGPSGELLIGFTSLDPAKPGKVRQTLKFIDDDHHSWKVELKAGDDWQTLIDAVWERKTKQ